jgi:hypothetical protein
MVVYIWRWGEFRRGSGLQLNKLIDQEVKNFIVVFIGVFGYEIGKK